MNNELANFFVSFTSQGFAELKAQLDGLNKNIDSLGQSMSKSDKGLSKLGSSFNKLAARLSPALIALKAFRDALNLKEEVINLQNMATAVGTGADKLEGMGRALRQFGGDWKTAGTLYGNITDMMEQLQWGQLDKTELISKYGVDIVNPLVNRDYNGVMRAIANAMQGEDIGSQRAIAKGFLGGDQSLQLFFSQGWEKVSQQLASAEEKNFKSNTENQRAARDLKDATENLKEAWQRAVIPLLGPLKEILEALNPLLLAMRPLFEAFGVVLKALAPLVSWVAEKLGIGVEVLSTGIEAATVGIRDGIKFLSGEMSGQEYYNSLMSTKAGQAGIKAGNWYTTSLIKNDATEAFKRINSGFYDLSDIQSGYKFFDLMAQTGELTTEQIATGTATLKRAAAAINYTNNPLNAGTTNNTSSTTNDVNIDTINVYDTTGSWGGKGRQIGQIVKDGINGAAFQPAYNTMGAI